MNRQCDVCASVGSRSPIAKAKSAKVRHLLLEDRLISLCDEHAEQVQQAGAATLEEVRTLFLEPGGKRSLVPRRAALDRRIFPARPEGRRGSDGRRDRDGTA